MKPAPEDEAPRDPEAVAEEEISRFERWFVTLGEERLTRHERAILKTYVIQRGRGSFESIV